MVECTENTKISVSLPFPAPPCMCSCKCYIALLYNVIRKLTLDFVSWNFIYVRSLKMLVCTENTNINVSFSFPDLHVCTCVAVSVIMYQKY